MTTQKDFKRLVRGRMQKTGESYTTARASLITQAAKRRSTGSGAHPETNGRDASLSVVATAAAAPKVQPADLAKLAGMADSVIEEKTGCAWDRWVWALDHVGAYNWPHRAIAQYVREKYQVADWWTQAVTVGYERIKGLREIGQRRSGSWEASKSKTINAAAGTVFKSFKQPKLRSGWLDARPVLRTAVPNKTIRMTWEDGSSVEVYVVSKGRSKTQVAVQHTKLPNREAVDRMKWFWGDHLDRLAAKLERKKRVALQ
jgi:hypothetical protein